MFDEQEAFLAQKNHLEGNNESNDANTSNKPFAFSSLLLNECLSCMGI